MVQPFDLLDGRRTGIAARADIVERSHRQRRNIFLAHAQLVQTLRDADAQREGFPRVDGRAPEVTSLMVQFQADKSGIAPFTMGPARIVTVK